jgi:hypothetical protein
MSSVGVGLLDSAQWRRDSVVGLMAVAGGGGGDWINKREERACSLGVFLLCSALAFSGLPRLASSEEGGVRLKGTASQLLAREVRYVGACGWSLRGGRPKG